MLTRRIFIALVVLLLGCSKEETATEWQKAPIPDIKPGATVHLRVVQAINPRLPRLSPEEMRVVLASAQLTAWKHFGVNLEFTEEPEISIARLFALLPPSLMDARRQSIYDFKNGSGDKHKLAEGINTTLTERGTKLEDALIFARPYLPPNAQPKDLMELSELLANVMLDRVGQWRQIKANDGAPVLDASPYNEWVYWDTLGYADLPYDLVITNQLIDSTEYYGADIHSALRGGVTVGTTSYSRTSPFSAYIFMSTFPFTDNSATTLNMRGGEQYSEVDAAELVGAYLHTVDTPDVIGFLDGDMEMLRARYRTIVARRFPAPKIRVID